MAAPLRFPAVAVLALALGTAACGEAPLPDRPNVVLVCIDTLRADHLGSYGYERETSPFIDGLAAESTVFADACATSSWTRPSVPSFMTGTYPLQHGLYGLEGQLTHALSQDAVTLAEVFAANGWRTGAIVRNPQLALGNGFEQGFEVYRDGSGDAAEIGRRARAWLDGLEDEAPFFLYLHYLDAHWPYPIPDEYATRFGGAQLEDLWGADAGGVRDAINEREREHDPRDIEQLLGLYDGGIRFVDDELARVVDAIEARGEWNDTIVCIVSDHGEEFMEHGRIGHGHGLQENLLRVPWILRIPGRRARTIETPVSLIDVFPTLLGAAGIEAPTTTAVDRLSTPRREEPVFAELKELRRYQHSLRRGQRKVSRRYVVEAQTDALEDGEDASLGPLLPRGLIPQLILGVQPPGVRLVDLDADPGERKARFDQTHSDPLEAELDAFARHFAATASFDDTVLELDEAQLEDLRQLGYIDR